MKRVPFFTDREKRDIVIYDIMVPSLRILYEEDYFNISVGVSERNICARLAHHMEIQMREFNHSKVFDDYYVDVEYNRMGYGNPKYYENHKHELKYMVSDLLIHSRGKSSNLLAVEMKRKGNYKNSKEDKERLEALVSSMPHDLERNCVYGTLVGAFITYSSDEAIIEVFEDSEGHDKKTDIIRFDCNNYGPKIGVIYVSRIINGVESIWEIHRYC